MRINVNAFIAVVLCTALLGGLWLLNTRNVLDDGVWNPHDMYNSVGGSGYSLSNVSSERSASSGTALTLPSLRTISHKASSVPYHLMASSPYSPIASSPHSPIASSPISYASSDAQFHSFGGGGFAAVDGGMGSFRPTMDASPTAASLSMPSYAHVTLDRNAEGQRPEVAAVSALTSVVQSTNPLYSYNGISTTSLDYGCYASLNSPLSAISQRYGAASTIGGSLDTWLQGLIGNPEYGWMDINDGSGIAYFDEDTLRELYLQAIVNGDLPGGLTWEQFLSWFHSEGSGSYAFPIPDGMWFMCIIALCYVMVIFYRNKQQKTA